LIDDDPAVRTSVSLLLTSMGHAVEAFESAQQFLDSYRNGRPGCIVVDVRMPGISGLELQGKLKSVGVTLPVIVITGYGDIPMAVRAMQAGAVTFLEKPFREQELWENVQKAIELDIETRRRSQQRTEWLERLSRLTTAERQVLDRVVAGHPNKQIAAELGVSQRTIEVRRANVMRKMQVDSVVELARAVQSLEQSQE
jgi:FixJ family two-component response regulator